MSRLVCCYAGDLCFKPAYLILYTITVLPLQIVENILITPSYTYICHLITLHAHALATGLIMGVALAQGIYQGWASTPIICLYSIHLAYTIGKVAIGVIAYAFENILQFIDIEEECRCLRSTRWRLCVLPHAAYLGMLCGLATALPLLRSLPATIVPGIHNFVSFFLVVVIGVFSGTMRQTVASNGIITKSSNTSETDLCLEDGL